MRDFEEVLKKRIAPFTDVPIVFTSVVTKQRILKAIETALAVYKNKTNKIPTSKLNDIMLPLIEAYPPPQIKGKLVKIKYITQLPTYNPCFAFFCNMPQYINDPYKRFLENQMRKHFDFSGVPIQLFFRNK